MNDLNNKLQEVRNALKLGGGAANTEQVFEQLSVLARSMARDGIDRDAPQREIPARLGDRWSTLLMLLLRIAPLRHSTLRRLVTALSAEGKISQRMLTLRLRTLERDGLISRRITDTHPPGMEYSITALGNSLLDQIEQLHVWIRTHKQEILDARVAFSQHQHAAVDIEE